MNGDVWLRSVVSVVWIDDTSTSARPFVRLYARTREPQPAERGVGRLRLGGGGQRAEEEEEDPVRVFD